MKILVIPSWYPSKQSPIAGIFFKEQAKALNEYIDVSVLNLNRLSLRNPQNIFKRKRNNIKKENGNLLTLNKDYINWFPKLYFLSNKLYENYLIKSYKKLVSEFGNPDIIHAHVTYPAGYGALILSEKFNIPFLVTEHASFFETHILKYHKKITYKILKEADKYTAVSSFLKNKIIDNGREQCDITPNFINFNRFENLELNEKFENNKFNLIHVSLMSEVKNIPLLLKSFQKVVYEFNNKEIHLHLIGDGKRKKKYIELAKKLRINNHCTFHGRLSNDRVISFMNKCDSLVISSKKETFGVVGIEAMACGLPVISTKCGGPEDYITSNTGILVENDNVRSLSNGIIEMLRNYSNYNSAFIKKYIKKNFSARAVSHELISLYKQIISN